MKRFMLIFLALLLFFVSCEVNVYIDNSKKIWRVGNIYFETANEAVNYIMTGSRSRSVTKTDDESRTITLTRPVLAENSDGVIDSSYEGYVEDESLRGEIKIPTGFEGDLCIDFNGYRYDFSNSSDAFFVIEGGDNIYIYNGETVIFNEASHTPFAIAVNTDTVTIDAHLLDDRRMDNNLVYVGESGHFRIVDVKPDETQNTFGGAVAVVTDGTSGAVLDIESSDVTITDIYTMYKNADGSVSETIDDSIVLSDTAKSAINVYSGAVTIKDINQSSDYYNSITTTVFDKAYLNILGKTENTEVQGGHGIYEVVEKAIENSSGEAEYKIYHELTHYPAVEVTCTTDGNIEYWHCSECGGYFSDEGITKITEEEIFTPHHTISEEWTYDEDNHWHVCLVDGNQVEVAPHSWGDWQEKTSGSVTHLFRECSVCEAREVATRPEYIVYDIGIGEAKLKAIEDTPCGDFYLNGKEVENGTSVEIGSSEITAEFRPYLGSNTNYKAYTFVISNGMQEVQGNRASDGSYSVNLTLGTTKQCVLNIQLCTEGGSLGFECYLNKRINK